MADIESTGGLPPITPHDRKWFEQEYREGAQLFQNAVDHYAKSDNPYQKREFHEVMEKALNILNETAHELNKKSLLEQNAQIAKDYDSFNKAPDDEKTINKLNADLEKAKKSV